MFYGFYVLYFQNRSTCTRPNKRVHEINEKENKDWHMYNKHFLLLFYRFKMSSAVRRLGCIQRVGFKSDKIMKFIDSTKRLFSFSILNTLLEFMLQWISWKSKPSSFTVLGKDIFIHKYNTACKLKHVHLKYHAKRGIFHWR